jgi:hypothetical protein
VSSVSFAAYRGLLTEPALRRLAIADACARLPQGMVSITLLLVAAEHASMAGKNEPEEEVRRELVDITARARRGDRHEVVPGRRHRGADR